MSIILTSEPQDRQFSSPRKNVKRVVSSMSFNLSQPAIEFERISVNTLDELDVKAITSPMTTQQTTDEQDLLTGHFGEEFVYKYLIWKYRDEQEICVEWLNDSGESYQPYDILVKKGDLPVQHIEVKTTTMSDQHTFQISVAEIEQMLNLSNYVIYRVYSLSNNPSICVINDIRHNLRDTRQLGLLMTIKPVLNR
ncbi:unnamed protein product [Didymodactylos carnosus]|uniref:Protein NO VEIN C-terminal domain-containing protein n=1 Tax=Didymodactylos carnosus TaxID=1234261 RepID=A0A815Z2L8_9BILA|nr:unnamed protein product [Didymodactylos carnosus]CAF1579211.1 unnamed protein product [Didymodactylos carnosus]CAF4266690.1 unnamed protein product [Didymodactylos carnosus]CAF4445960.1 unnamed protein product [Didymodactylos carnosus]